MISRISSFSGPLAKLFKVPYVTGFTTTGLILRYEMSLTSSYAGSGTSVVDLAGNSNATLVNAPTYSTNGYLTFDGVNEYLMTNTSLNSKLSPANTSNIISFFVWVYPIDNGVIVTEQGVGGSINTAWHDSQLEMVNGVVKFGVWSGAGSTSVSSSISTPFNNWYYLGLTYDGATLRGYVNGQLAGSVNVTRSAPYSAGSGLFYAIAANDATSLGDGTYANMKFGAFHVYNIALSAQQVLNNYRATISNYIVTSNLLFWIDANDDISFSGGSIKDLSGNSYTHSLNTGATSSNIFGIKSFDCSTANNVLLVNSTGPTLSNSGYTYVSWARIISSNAGYRTLYRTSPNDHPLLINVSSDTLGSYDNDTDAFYSSGYNITSVEEQWTQWSVVGDSNGSDFYINDAYVGSSTKGASGNKHSWIGNVPGGQPFGYIGNTMMYNSKLSADEIKQNYDALKDVYKNGNFVIDNLKLYFNPNSILSYPKTGTTVTDLTGNSLNGTLSNVTYSDPYFSFNGSNSQISITDNALLEPGSDDFTMEVWFNASALNSSSVILGKFDNGGASQDVSYSIRVDSNGGRIFSQIGNGSTVVNSTYYTPSLNTWYQVVYVWKNIAVNTFETYINGSSIGSVSHAFVSILNTSNNLYLGSYNNGEYSQYFNGKIGIVRFYNSALSASDISKNFEANRSIYGI